MDSGGSGAKRRGTQALGGVAAETPATALVGAQLGNYRVGGLLGQGGMGSVYLAEHVLIGRKVAIKVLAPQIADQAEVVARFFVEARSVNEIRHPNIVEVTDLGTHAGRPFIVMEFLGGETLEGRLGRKLRLPVDETVNIARQVASALGAAHDRGLVHRDLKPANVMLLDHPDYPDFVKVLDFGIAKLLGSAAPGEHRTELGALLGTPAFMSPEQCLGDLQLDHRSDVYSLGVMVFLMLAGRLPFEGDAIGRLILAHVNQPPPRLSTLVPDVPEALSAAVDRALAKKPQDRFADMRGFRRAMDEACGRPRSLTPVLEVLAVADVTPPPARTVVPSPAQSPVRAPGPASVVRAPAAAARRPDPAALTPRPVVTPALNALAEPADVVRARLSEAVKDKVERGALAFPVLPEIASQCLEMLRDPGYSFAVVAGLIRRDGRLASHVVRRANGEGAPGRGIATNPEQAMGRLGSEWLRVTILELGARQAIDVRDPRFEDMFRRPWQHALAGAIAADRLARVLGLDAKAADAYLAGLLRDAGVSLLAHVIAETERELAGRKPPRATPVETVVELVNLHHRAVTAALIRHWQLPAAIGDAIAAAAQLDWKAGWSLGNLIKTAGAIADREGFYLRRDALGEAEATIEAAVRELSLADLRARKVADRLKEAVRLRE
jgi:HD-like signal output (HDOD) protein/tRNA A-37 threonylcarbamoyl transferase component Bud32